MNDLFDAGHMSRRDMSLRDGTGHHPKGVSLSRCPVPVSPEDTDPAAAWRNRKERREAWDQWEQSGGTLDDLPPGLVSASLDAAMKREPGPQRWRR